MAGDVPELTNSSASRLSLSQDCILSEMVRILACPGVEVSAIYIYKFSCIYSQAIRVQYRPFQSSLVFLKKKIETVIPGSYRGGTMFRRNEKIKKKIYRR